MQHIYVLLEYGLEEKIIFSLLRWSRFFLNLFLGLNYFRRMYNIPLIVFLFSKKSTKIVPWLSQNKQWPCLCQLKMQSFLILGGHSPLFFITHCFDCFLVWLVVVNPGLIHWDKTSWHSLLFHKKKLTSSLEILAHSCFETIISTHLRITTSVQSVIKRIIIKIK